MAIKNTKQNTPKHCHNCWKFNECLQAQNMTANTESVDAYYYDSDLYCELCSPENSEYIGNVGEVDTPAHCGLCGIPLECQLTTDGINYVREALNRNDGCCRELWKVLYADYL